MKKQTTKLSLSKETLRALTPGESAEVAGGGFLTFRVSGCPTCGSAVACCAPSYAGPSCPCD